MQYITVGQAAEKWGVTVRRVQDLCNKDQIHGAVRWGRDWMIPADAHRPADRRRKKLLPVQHDPAQLPRKNPAILLSNIYHAPGTADAVAQSLSEKPEAAKLFRAQLAFCRGQLEQCSTLAQEILQNPCGHDLQIGAGLILANCAVVSGKPEVWVKAKNCIAEAPCHNTRDRLAVDFWVAAAESELRETATFPLWFTRGSFDVLPGDSFPSARFFYLRFLYLMGHEFALGHHGSPDAQTKMALLPYVAEPLIAQNRKEGALVSELYTRLICACSYHDIGNDAMAILHLDQAISLALPDKLYMPLAEYRRQLDFLMDARLSAVSQEALSQVKALNRAFLEGWTVLHNTQRGRRVTNDLTTREREVAKHAAFGLSNKEIAERLNISINTVKQSLRTAMDKTGALRRSDLYHYI